MGCTRSIAKTLKVREKSITQTNIQRAVLAVAAVVLAGCSSEPSNAEDAKSSASLGAAKPEAMGKLADGNPQAAEMAKSLQPKVHSVNKIGCKSDGDKAYKCDVELDMETGLTGRKKANRARAHGQGQRRLDHGRRCEPAAVNLVDGLRNENSALVALFCCVAVPGSWRTVAALRDVTGSAWPKRLPTIETLLGKACRSFR